MHYENIYLKFTMKVTYEENEKGIMDKLSHG